MITYYKSERVKQEAKYTRLAIAIAFWRIYRRPRLEHLVYDHVRQGDRLHRVILRHTSAL